MDEACQRCIITKELDKKGVMMKGRKGGVDIWCGGSMNKLLKVLLIIIIVIVAICAILVAVSYSVRVTKVSAISKLQVVLV